MEGEARRSIRELFERLLLALEEEVLSFYGERLTSLAVFGSVGGGTFRADSDVDLLVVASSLPRGRVARAEEFLEAERRLEGLLPELRGLGLDAHLSPVIRTEEEVQRGSPLFLDMTEDPKVLFDRGDLPKGYLQRLRERLSKDRGQEDLPGGRLALGPEGGLKEGGPHRAMTSRDLARSYLFEAQKRLKSL